jgi:hypothetical protein
MGFMISQQNTYREGNIENNSQKHSTKNKVVQRKSGLKFAQNPQWPSQDQSHNVMQMQANGDALSSAAAPANDENLVEPCGKLIIANANETDRPLECEGVIYNNQLFLNKNDIGTLNKRYQLEVPVNDNTKQHPTRDNYYSVSSELAHRFADTPDFIMAVFDSATVIAEVPADQANLQTQKIRVGTYGLIRTFAKIEYVAEREKQDLESIMNHGNYVEVNGTRHIVTDPDEMDDYKKKITKALEDIGGTYANVWRDSKDFQVSSEVVWFESNSRAKPQALPEDEYLKYQIEPGHGRAHAVPLIAKTIYEKLQLLIDELNNPMTDEQSKQKIETVINDKIHLLYPGFDPYNINEPDLNTVHLYTQDFNDPSIIIHETLHMMGFEDAYEEAGRQPRANPKLVPDEAMMHSRIGMTNLEIRMLFDQDKANHPVPGTSISDKMFRFYEDEFSVLTGNDIVGMWEEQKEQVRKGNSLVFDPYHFDRIAVTLKKDESNLEWLNIKSNVEVISVGIGSGSASISIENRRGDWQVQGSEATCASGKLIKIKAVPNNNCHFEKWEVVGKNISLLGPINDKDNSFYMGIENVKIRATFVD